MPRYVGLVRGINVGGKNSVPMAALRELFESLGHTEVSTYIQSGNVIFTAGKSVPAKSIETAIGTRFGIEPAVILRTASDLEKIVAANPFPRADRARLHVGFMASKAPAAAVAKLDADRFLPDEFALHGTELYLHLPGGMGRAKLPAYLDRQLEIPTTVRNWTTVTKLLDLARS